MIPAYKDPNHPTNKIRPRTRCWGCDKMGCVGKRWGNWCFDCNVKRIDRISGALEELSKSGSIDGVNCRVALEPTHRTGTQPEKEER